MNADLGWFENTEILRRAIRAFNEPHRYHIFLCRTSQSRPVWLKYYCHTRLGYALDHPTRSPIQASTQSTLPYAVSPASMHTLYNDDSLL